jgi:tRNA/rRNA methyltransferase/tRNA (cytidine32/uridine32-2'-O)-methyltransferase
MANMGLSELRLVEPAAAAGDVARAFAVGAREVLLGARRFDSLAAAVAPFRRVVGTTSARDRALAVPVVTPRELAERLPGGGTQLPTALVFGPEVGGLTNDELALCHLVVTVPCAPVQPTLNLAQAVLLVAYELFLARGAAPLIRFQAGVREEPPAPAAAIDGLFEHLTGVLEEVGFARDTTFHGVVRDLRQLAGRARATEREVTILRGILRRARNALRRGEPPD